LLEISFSIYIQKKNLSSVHFVRDEIVRLPNTGFKWTNVDAGVYFIYAYVERAHCRLNCNDAKVSLLALIEIKAIFIEFPTQSVFYLPTHDDQLYIN
jgi:hypothetical protein